MKRKGFTLVELLAVIVILALVTLITIPVILNVIEKSKIKTYQRSIDSYGRAVEKGIAEYIMDNEGKSISGLNISTLKNGNYIKYEGNKVECTVNIYQDKTIYLENCKVNGEDVDYTYGNKIKYAKLLSDSDNNNKVSVGDKYSYKVNETETFDFYVLSQEGTGKHQKINLIMDGNICGDGKIPDSNNSCTYEWDKHPCEMTNIYGPENALDELYKGTKDWSNVPNIEINYTDEGNSYGTIKTVDDGLKLIKSDGTESMMITYADGKKMKSRLPMYSELTNLGCSLDSNSCPTWLAHPTWLLSSPGSGDGAYYFAEYRKSLRSRSYFVYSCGARDGYLQPLSPVITVSLSDLE